MSEWSAEQDRALRAVSAWLSEKRGPQVFRLFGYAGTGKTTLARHIAEDQDGDVLFAAYTGKAAHVLRQRGCTDAQTIHSLIYRPRVDEGESPTFVINRDSPVGKADLIIIDECSMVDEELGRDLLSFGTKVLVLGDPGQLPPVRGGGFFTEAEPDLMLTEIHRQAADNPIIRLSMAVREGESLQRGTYGESRVVGRESIDSALALAADQILVGRNKTRRLYNKRIRELMGLRDPMPAAGDKLVCLRNDKTRGLLNGGLWNVKALRGFKKDLVQLLLTPDDGGKSVKVGVHREFFIGENDEIPFALRRGSDEFDYGYALTVHKAQGSQWDNVLLFDESWAFRENRTQWLYTALTRAAERITVVV